MYKIPTHQHIKTTTKQHNGWAITCQATKTFKYTEIARFQYWYTGNTSTIRYPQRYGIYKFSKTKMKMYNYKNGNIGMQGLLWLLWPSPTTQSLCRNTKGTNTPWQVRAQMDDNRLKIQSGLHILQHTPSWTVKIRCTSRLTKKNISWKYQYNQKNLISVATAKVRQSHKATGRLKKMFDS